MPSWIVCSTSWVPAIRPRSVLLRTYRLAFPHAFAEEAVLWPALRRAAPEGAELTLRVEQEHQEVNELVARGRPPPP